MSAAVVSNAEPSERVTTSQAIGTKLPPLPAGSSAGGVVNNLASNSNETSGNVMVPNNNGVGGAGNGGNTQTNPFTFLSTSMDTSRDARIQARKSRIEANRIAKMKPDKTDGNMH
jgi:hypothetical protein